MTLLRKKKNLVLCSLVLVVFSIALCFPAHAFPDIALNGFPHNDTLVKVSGNGEYLVMGDTISGILTLLRQDGSPIWNLTTGVNLSSVAVSDDGWIIAASSDDGRIFGFDTSGNLLWEHTGMGRFTQIMVTRDGRNAYVINSDNFADSYTYTVHKFSRNGTILWEIREPGISSASMTPDGEYLAIGTRMSGNGAIRLFSGNGTSLWDYPAPDGIEQISLSSDGSTLAAIHSYRLLVMDTNRKILCSVIPRHHPEHIGISDNSENIITSSSSGLQGFTRNGTSLWERDIKGVNAIEISRNNRTFVSGSDTMIFIYTDTGTPVHMERVEHRVGTISISADGNVILAGSKNGRAFLLNNGSGIQWISPDNRSIESPPVRINPVQPADLSRKLTGTPKQADIATVSILLALLYAIIIVTRGNSR